MKNQVTTDPTSNPAIDSHDSEQSLAQLYAEEYGHDDDSDDTTVTDETLNAGKTAFDDSDSDSADHAKTDTADTHAHGQGDVLDAGMQTNNVPQDDVDWQQKAQEFEHKFKSEQGRAAAAQSKLAAAQQRLQTLEAQQIEFDAPELDEDAKSLLEEMPELRAITDSQSQITARQQAILREQRDLQMQQAQHDIELAQQEVESYQQTQQALFEQQIDAVHPGFMDTWHSPEFVAFYEQLDPFDQQRALNGGPQGVIATLNTFKAQQTRTTNQPPISNRPASRGSAPQLREGEFDLETAFEQEWG